MSGRTVRWLVVGLVSGCLAVAPAAVGAAPVQPGSQPAVRHPMVVQLTAVDSVSADDAWAVGFTARGPSSRTLVEHWDGSSWSVVASPNQGKLLNRLDGVYASGPDDVWAVGSFDTKQDGELHNLAMHWDGESWTVSNPPDAAPNRTNGLLSITGSSPTDVWAGGYLVNNDGRTLATLFHWDGAKWSEVRLVHGPVGDPVQGLTRFDGSYWAVGPCVGGCESAGWRGMVARLRDGSWKDLRTPNLGRTVDAAAAADGDLWTVADGAVARFDGAAWRRLPNPSIGRMVAVAAPTLGFTMVLAAEAAAVWDGSGWDAVPTPRVGQLLDVDLDSASSGWAVGSTGTAGLVERWDGNRFTRYPLGQDGPTAPSGDQAAPTTCYAKLYANELSTPSSAVSQQSDDDPGIESAGAAGFTVTKPCVIGLVEAFGRYIVLHGPADFETVTFYRNENGTPGAVLDRQNVQGADFQGHFLIPLHTVRLEPGAYFVSVVAHMNSASGGFWRWDLHYRHGSIDQFENPGGGLYDCLTWRTVGSCIGQGEADFEFLVALRK